MTRARNCILGAGALILTSFVVAFVAGYLHGYRHIERWRPLAKTRCETIAKDGWVFFQGADGEKFIFSCRHESGEEIEKIVYLDATE